jgi:hypothetical protein
MTDVASTGCDPQDGPPIITSESKQDNTSEVNKFVSNPSENSLVQKSTSSEIDQIVSDTDPGRSSTAITEISETPGTSRQEGEKKHDEIGSDDKSGGKLNESQSSESKGGDSKPRERKRKSGWDTATQGVWSICPLFHGSYDEFFAGTQQRMLRPRCRPPQLRLPQPYHWLKMNL